MRFNQSKDKNLCTSDMMLVNNLHESAVQFQDIIFILRKWQCRSLSHTSDDTTQAIKCILPQTCQEACINALRIRLGISKRACQTVQ